jgi:hypothetical protein
MGLSFGQWGGVGVTRFLWVRSDQRVVIRKGLGAGRYGKDNFEGDKMTLMSKVESDQ